MFLDDSKRLTCQILRLDWFVVVGYVWFSATKFRAGPRALTNAAAPCGGAAPLTSGLLLAVGSEGCFLQEGLRTTEATADAQDPQPPPPTAGTTADNAPHGGSGHQESP